MAGTAIGGRKAAQKILERDPDHYSRIGSRGGKVRVPKGFALMDSARHRAVSAKGGYVKRDK